MNADYGCPALDVPKEEAWFLTKLDLTLITASALGVMCRYLDQVNITNAFSQSCSTRTSEHKARANSTYQTAA